MKVICLDDGYPGLEEILKKCRSRKDFTEAKGFENAREAVDYFSTQDSKAMLLDIKEDALRVRVKTFGSFEVFADGKPLHFYRSRAKEILAYLVDRQGSGISRPEIFSAIYEDEDYDRSHQKQFDVMIRSLRKTLEENGIADIMEMDGGLLRIVPERISCDLYRFFEGDEETIRSYRGEYMSNYTWAMMTEAYMDQSMILKR